MKRIVFYVNKKPTFSDRLSFSLRMFFGGLRVRYKEASRFSCVNPKELIVTDDFSVYKKIEGFGSNSIVKVYSEDELSKTFEAKYISIDTESAEPEYFKEIYARINNLPLEFLRTKRLILRETVEKDVDDFYELYKNPKMTEFTEGLYEDLSEERKYVREYREKIYSMTRFAIYTVVRKSDKKIIGRAGMNIREGFERIEVGFAIGCDYQRNGYAYEAMKAVLKKASELSEEKHFALVMPGNIASKGLLSKLGFIKASETRLNDVLYEVWED